MIVCDVNATMSMTLRHDMHDVHLSFPPFLIPPPDLCRDDITSAKCAHKSLQHTLPSFILLLHTPHKVPTPSLSIPFLLSSAQPYSLYTPTHSVPLPQTYYFSGNNSGIKLLLWSVLLYSFGTHLTRLMIPLLVFSTPEYSC